MKLSAHIWTELLDETTRRYSWAYISKSNSIVIYAFDMIYFRLPGASNQKCIHKLLFQIAEHYKKQEREIDFVVDLLDVEAPELFAIRVTEGGEEDKQAVTDFEQDLSHFIAQNHLNHKLLSIMEEILVRYNIKNLASVYFSNVVSYTLRRN